MLSLGFVSQTRHMAPSNQVLQWRWVKPTCLGEWETCDFLSPISNNLQYVRNYLSLSKKLTNQNFCLKDLLGIVIKTWNVTFILNLGFTSECWWDESWSLFLFFVYFWLLPTLQRVVCVVYAFDTLESTAFPHWRDIKIQLGTMSLLSLDKKVDRREAEWCSSKQNFSFSCLL